MGVKVSEECLLIYDSAAGSVNDERTRLTKAQNSCVAEVISRIFTIARKRRVEGEYIALWCHLLKRQTNTQWWVREQNTIALALSHLCYPFAYMAVTDDTYG